MFQADETRVELQVVASAGYKPPNSRIERSIRMVPKSPCLFPYGSSRGTDQSAKRRSRSIHGLSPLSSTCLYSTPVASLISLLNPR